VDGNRWAIGLFLHLNLGDWFFISLTPRSLENCQRERGSEVLLAPYGMCMVFEGLMGCIFVE